jgi:hypothetical protein
LGRSPIGAKKKEHTGFSIDPDVLTEARKNANKIPLSSIVESLLIIYNKNPAIIKQASS